MFAVGLGIFTAASAAAALAPSIEALLVAARAIQGVGGAIVMPLTLTILSAAVPAERRGARPRRVGRHRRPRRRARPARRRRGRLRPLLAVDLLDQRADRPRADPARAAAPRRDATGPRAGSTCPGSASSAPACSGSSGASSGATARAGRARRSWSRSPAAHRARRRSCSGSSAPNRRCCRCASSATGRSRMTNVASLLMFFGMFGSIFLLAQFFQTVQGYSPFGSGLRILPWTAMPIFVAPIAGALSDRIGGRRDHGHRPHAAGDRARLDRGGQRRRRPRTPSWSAPFILSGVGMGLFFAPVANVVLSRGAAAGRGPGVGREQRDPRARRRLRRRGARLDLRRTTAATARRRPSSTG